MIGTYCQLLAETHWDPPQEDDLVQARVACIDPFFREESVQAAAFGTCHHIPVVITDCKHDHDILSLPSSSIQKTLLDVNISQVPLNQSIFALILNIDTRAIDEYRDTHNSLCDFRRANNLKPGVWLMVTNEGLVDLILESIADGVFTINHDFKITSFNRAAEEITKFSREEAIGQYCCEIFRANVCFEDCALKETLATGQNLVNREITILNAENEEVPVSISTAVLKDSDGNFVGGVETFRDLSVIKQLTREAEQRYSFQDILSKHPAFLRLFDILPDIAQSQASVLVQGESGTGKELVARAIHNLSVRKDHSLIVVNCGALPDNLLESELFGYVKGAFTDARQDKPGRFQLADRGTLFLDEIGDISPAMQVKLLRVLQEGTFEPLGSTKTHQVDVRIIAATSRNIPELIESGQFRQDLYYRLNVMTIDLPPLRERQEDVPLLVNHYIQHFNQTTGKQIQGLNHDALRILLDYDYPGNVRELRNILEHAFVLCKENEVTVACLPAYLISTNPATSYQKRQPQASNLQDIELQTILGTLKQYNGNKTKAANALGIDRSTLWRKLKRHGITSS